MNRYEAHQNLVKLTKFKITKEFPRSVRMFDRVVGVFYKKRIDNNVISYSHISIGKKGQCDEYGVISCGLKVLGANSPVIPIHAEWEFKTGDAILNPDQEIWRDFCLRMGILWFEVRENTDIVKEMRNKLDSMGLFIWR